MAKFLWHGSYSKGGAKALVEEGGTKRRAGVERAVTAMGGTLEAMYFAFGDDDYYAIVVLPARGSGPSTWLWLTSAYASRVFSAHAAACFGYAWTPHKSGPNTSYRIRDAGTPRASRVDRTCRMNGSGPQVNTWTSSGSVTSDKSIRPCLERWSATSTVSYQV